MNIKLGRVTIHPGGLAFVALIVYLCVENRSLMPLLYGGLFLAVLVPLCYYVHIWNEKQNAKMLEEFPYDPYIQAKYGNKKKNGA